MVAKLATKTGTAERVLRTAIQALPAAAIAVPVLVRELGVPAHLAGEIVAYSAGSVVAVSWIVNYLEGKGWMPSFLKGVNVAAPTQSEVAAAASVDKPLMDELRKGAAVANTVQEVVNTVKSAETVPTP